MPTKRKSKGAYMISAVAEMYEIHPQTLRLYEREGLLQPSRTVGNTRLYTDEDLERLEFILNLARELGVNIAGIAIILQMRERMEEMNRQMQDFVEISAELKRDNDGRKLKSFVSSTIFAISRLISAFKGVGAKRRNKSSGSL